MKKSCFIFLAIILIILTGCKHRYSENPDTEDIDNNHKWTDVSDNQFNFENIPDFSFSGKTIYAEVKSGKESGTSLRNFLLSGLGRQNITGFEAQTKLGKNMKSCGFEFSGVPSYSCYLFKIYKDGSFDIMLDDYRTRPSTYSRLAHINADKSGINLNDFNTIKMRSLPNEKDAEIFINGTSVYTIEDLIFTPGTLAIYYQAEKGTYSNENTAEAEFRILSVQKKSN